MATRRTFLWTLGESSFAADLPDDSTKAAQGGGKKGGNSHMSCEPAQLSPAITPAK
jgi:hypothetical protein